MNYRGYFIDGAGNIWHGSELVDEAVSQEAAVKLIDEWMDGK